MVKEALSSEAVIERVLVSDKFAAGPAWPELEASSRDTTIISITETQAQQLGDTRHPQEIFAVLKIPVAHSKPHPPVIPPVLILDGISDPGNLGTLLRTAEWFGVRTVLASATSADVYNPKVVRSGMGAHFYLPALWQGESMKIPPVLGSKDILLLGATLTGKLLDQLPSLGQNWALVIGSEAHGLSELWSERLDIALTISGAGSGANDEKQHSDTQGRRIIEGHSGDDNH